MLQKIRDRTQGTIAKFIIALIVVPFALWGIESFFTGGVPDVAEVNGTAISQTQLEQAIELQRRQLQAESSRIDPASLEDAKLRGPVLDAIIDRVLLREVAERSGFRASDALIDRLILADESFHENGQFSQARFQNILGSNGMTPMYYRNLLQEDMLINVVLSGLASSDFVSKTELADIARLTMQSMDVRFLTVPVSSADTPVEIPAERVQAYYDGNKDEFRTEETVRVDYLELSLEDLFEPVPEETLREEFAQRMEKFVAGQDRHAAHIMLSSLDDGAAQAKLAELRTRIAGGEDFALLAKDNSEDVGSAASGGDLGYTSGDAFPKDFEAALAALEPGEVSAPVRTEAGWHLIKLLDMRKQEPPKFEDQRTAIELELQRRAAQPLYVGRAEKLADLTYNSDGLADAARELGLELKHSEPFSRRGGEGLFADARVIAAAFGDDVLRNAQNSVPLEVDAEHTIVIHLAEHADARQQELTEVEERIRTLLAESIRREQAGARATALLEKLRNGAGTIEDLAKAENLQWQVALGHRRGATGVPRELGEEVFRLPYEEGSIGRSTVVLANGDAVVLEVSNFKDGALEQLPEEQRKQMRALLAQSRGTGVAAHYRKRLREIADVRMMQ